MNEWSSLPESALEELADFLELLQANPDDRNLLERCEIHDGSKFAYVFARDYAVYWKVIRKHDTGIMGLDSFDPIRIEILDVRKIENP